MSSLSESTNEQGIKLSSQPNSSWVRFLRSYGPTSNNLTMFDEYVVGALGRAKVHPIELSTPLLDKMVEHIESKVPGSILIAGTAGDGKTYHCRALWVKFGGSTKDWSTKGNIKELPLADGRLAVFIKDLSEFNGDESDLPLQRLERSVLEGDDSEIIILAANHGQLLDRLRDIGRRQGRNHPLRKPLQEQFLQAGPAPNRLAVFDLSRLTNRKTLDEAIRTIAAHSEWEKCKHCSLKYDGKVCPIDENRRRLLGEFDSGQLALRLADLIEIARLNGLHIPTRDILALCSNMILGYSDAKVVRENLMTCADVVSIQDRGELVKASIYTNAFGANLPKRRAAGRPIFKAMASFGAGEETSNAIDGLLVYGNDDSRLRVDFDRLIGSDPIYGASVTYYSSQSSYLEGDESVRLDDGASEFLELLEAQRRRLFFTLPDDELNYPYWSMTVFRFAGDYLSLIESLKAKKIISDLIKGRIVKGLNRVITGLLLENSDKIFVASSGGFTQSRVSVLCDYEIPSRKQAGVGLSIKINEETSRPFLEISFAPGQSNCVSFDLTPIRHEFLSRISEGALPASFSNECLEDLLAFKAKLLRKAQMVCNTLADYDDEEFGTEDSAMTLNFIDIEPGGCGFVRPMTVRWVE
ncbi:hypothetical protein [Pantoea agglomerans]|jgi:hypothetical protein|uniref:hypothetical protein n=1 Tax=Enterobacter agglomerans TaxID=549 RepID=UPI00223B8394|nr:hypothetical protein [Pantoea agglomerans]